MGKVLKRREFSLSIIIIILIIIISIRSPVFLTFQNILNIFNSINVLAIVAIGMTVIIINGSIDISVGSQLAVISVIISELSLIPGMNIFILLIVSMLIGAFLSLANGFISTRANVPHIMISFGALNVYRGAILLYTGGSWVWQLPAWFKSIWDDFLWIPIPFYILSIVGLATWLMLNNTKIGRQIFAVGGNKNAAIRVGINVKNIMLFGFVCLGMLIGIGSLLYTAQTGSGSPVSGLGFELQVIAAVIIGGASIFGGRGSVLATLLGVLLIGIIQNGLILTKIPLYYQSVVNGLIIIIAITSDVIRQRRESARPFITNEVGKKKTIRQKW